MTEITIFILSSLGTLFILLAAIGVVKMPDLYLRISVTTKAATLGIGLILVAAAFYFNDSSITARVLAIILFMLLTAPVGAHMIGRASYFTGVKMWKKSILDDLEGQYDPKTHKLSSEDQKSLKKDSHNPEE
ncbi:sodium:proton antiporter [Rhodonellum psychrophilum GCM71 = DSM 17998]|uniref:Sodium:proton antiporter n=2 Tax=Rhodonellum TaxID=336827 RepID=U5BZX1_9BACT|nr:MULTISPECIES: monovalent cation/H(+) antiporter subunit G [Rhodonellum]ERM81447.1 sodium:proton antiporter [Rhodonellum psychrophilum GCM71 = DSM 17998]MDO9552808.1 monovalent cation/H(+) antiporter subunit G [Rhodonellum sp.]SDZ27395.1 multisubunit sodium/proton antiporter, MrpG subunit [Rhodonellum ikkaensis]